ncbi:MAG: class I SAM-dependent methyltransferase [Sulfurovum sp.]|nr:class I SAM-dependent methyltransferase [Sulfurovum sp.]
MKEDMFANKSKNWDMNSKRVRNTRNITELIVKNIELNHNMELMDFGAGTGLLSFLIAPFVKKITAVDNSPSMLREFKNKCSEFACETEIIKKDLSEEVLERVFDGIISSMTIHHLEDTYQLFRKFYQMLKKGGFIAIADLDIEDGSFHSDNRGVFHHGFDRKVLRTIAKEAGFREIQFETASTISKPQREFTVFLMTAYRD